MAWHDHHHQQRTTQVSLTMFILRKGKGRLMVFGLPFTPFSHSTCMCSKKICYDNDDDFVILIFIALLKLHVCVCSASTLKNRSSLQNIIQKMHFSSSNAPHAMHYANEDNKKENWSEDCSQKLTSKQQKLMNCYTQHCWKEKPKHQNTLDCWRMFFMYWYREQCNAIYVTYLFTGHTVKKSHAQLFIFLSLN